MHFGYTCIHLHLLARVKPFKPQRASIVTKGRYTCQNLVPIGLVGKLLAWELWAFAAQESHIVGGRVEELPLLLSLGLRRSSASAGGAAAASRAGSTKAGGATAAVRAEFGFGWRNGCSDSGGGVRLRLEERLQRFGRRTSATAVEV